MEQKKCRSNVGVLPFNKFELPHPEEDNCCNQTRRVKYVWYKRPTLDEGRLSFTWVELTNDENVKSMFWEHNMFQWIDMQVTLLRSTEDIINSLIAPEGLD